MIAHTDLIIALRRADHILSAKFGAEEMRDMNAQVALHYKFMREIENDPEFTGAE